MKGGILPTLIDQFDGPWRVLSNFYYPIQIKLWVMPDGTPAASNLQEPDFNPMEEYDSTEHGYQAAKFLDPLIRERFRYAGMTPGQAKRLAYNLRNRIRSDWKEVNISLMRDLLKQKFAYSIPRRKLLSTFSALLVEGNMWHDNFWGNCICSDCIDILGENWLGKLLMEIRNSFIS